MRIFLTGGAGFLGGYIAEAALREGHEVRALVRGSSDTRHLQEIGAELAKGDLSDSASLRAGLAGCDVAIHAAAKVGDWGQWPDFHEQNVAASRRLYDAAVTAGVPRAVHVSSVGVYGKGSLLETVVEESAGPAPLDSLPSWYHYGRAKIMAETLALEYHAAGTLQMSVVRPGWIYGPRDRLGLAAMLRRLASGNGRCIGAGDNELCLTYAGNVADGVLLAATHPAAPGEAFNVSNDEPVTQRQYLDALADLLGVKHVAKSIPLRRALLAAWLLEKTSLALRRRTRPAFTRQAIMLLGARGVFSTQKIRQRLGWTPRVSFANAMALIKEWWERERTS